MEVRKVTMTTIDARYLVVGVPVRYGEEDIPNDAPGRSGDWWKATIDLDSGRIHGWPGGALDLHMKVCDQGSYRLCDAAGLTIAERTDDYVPGFLPGDHYGDYVILDIAEDGRIRNWEVPTASAVESAFDLVTEPDA